MRAAFRAALDRLLPLVLPNDPGYDLCATSRSAVGRHLRRRNQPVIRERNQVYSRHCCSTLNCSGGVLLRLTRRCSRYDQMVKDVKGFKAEIYFHALSNWELLDDTSIRLDEMANIQRRSGFKGNSERSSQTVQRRRAEHGRGWSITRIH